MHHPKTRSSSTEVHAAFATLGLSSTTKACTPREIKAAFRKKALEWHPDCSVHENAEATFKEIVLAYELVLSLIPEE